MTMNEKDYSDSTVNVTDGIDYTNRSDMLDFMTEENYRLSITVGKYCNSPSKEGKTFLELKCE